MEIKNTSPTSAKEFFSNLTQRKPEPPLSPANQQIKDSLEISSQPDYIYTIIENGKPVQKKFSSQKTIATKKNPSLKKDEPKKKKEEIGDFVLRSLNEIRKVGNDPKKNLTGVYFEYEDLQEIAALDGGKTMKMIRGIVDSVVYMQGMRKKFSTKQKIENVLLKPQRKMIDDYGS